MAEDPTTDFRVLAERSIDAALAFDPVAATWAGDHRHDGELECPTPDAVARRLLEIDEELTALDAIDDVELPHEDFVDLEILRARLLRTQFELAELKAHTWNPIVWNPGTAVHLLLARDFAPFGERAASLRSRIEQIPDYLASARATLDFMPEIHVDTAIAQLHGTRTLLADVVPSELRENHDERSSDSALVEDAVAAVNAQITWLTESRARAPRSPRLGSHLYAGVLWHALDAEVGAETLLRQAEAHLDDVTSRMRDCAAEYLGVSVHEKGVVRRALAEIADNNPVTDVSVLADVERAMARTTHFVREHDLVTIPDLDVRIIEMPEIHRGVAVAYCDAPGPLETANVATYVAVSPTPNGWSREQADSFYREYNGVLLHDLTIHEAMPGHVVQLAHARELVAPTRVRRFGTSGVFVEGWAVYAEEMMVNHGYQPFDDPRSHLALTLQQLKMQARMAINAILDVRVHTMEMTEQEALDLMHWRGFQEQGEAEGKWRRALLTAGQLPTYFVGYQQVRSLAHDLRVLHPEWTSRAIHDVMLGQGSPAPRHLRELLGI